MFVRQEHRIDLDDIGRYAFTGTRDWRQWLEDKQVRSAATDRGIAGLKRSRVARAVTE